MRLSDGHLARILHGAVKSQRPSLPSNRSIYFLVLCLAREEGKQFKEQEERYQDIWARCKINTKTKPITNLNRELKIAVNNYTQEQKLETIDRDINYQVKMFKDTPSPLSSDVIEKKRNWYMKRPMSTEFTRIRDNKWRHPTKRWKQFNKYLPSKIFNFYRI